MNIVPQIIYNGTNTNVQLNSIQPKPFINTNINVNNNKNVVPSMLIVKLLFFISCAKI